MSERPATSVPAVLIGALAGGAISLLGASLSAHRRLDLGALEIAFIAGAYPAMAFHAPSRRAIAIEFAVSGAFVGLALTGLERRSRMAIACGPVGHAGWDAIHHLTSNGTKTPRWFPAFCMVADVALAAQFLWSS
jgi:hypothetical protein